ncbi:hypothetical protein, partial [Megasphaera sp.]|uniref:hypothetical protein n=1 Tax=Megasphaera sp. TaxID=2023260 RepID=UPI003FD8C597
MFYSYDSILVEPIQCNRIAVSDAEGLSEKEIVNKILIREFDHYKSERLFTKNKIFDYTINRIDGPIKIRDSDGMDKNYYDISYSVKTIDSAWIAGNGKNEGLWVNNKSGFFILNPDLSHHRAYRSKRGGFLIFTYLFVIARHGYITRAGYFFVRKDRAQHKRRSPWSFSA